MRAYRRRTALGIGAIAALVMIIVTLNFDSATLAQATSDPVLVGAGDIASCKSRGDEATAKLLANISGTVVTLGDNAYDNGSKAQFAYCYGRGWGHQKGRTRPSTGNHDYETAGASGYFNYFGARAGGPKRGYYAYNLGRWHIVVLNSNCNSIGGCGRRSPQVKWLRSNLAANRTSCTLAYWHHPRFSSGGEHGNDPRTSFLWTVLYNYRADVILSGHDHDYERFAPQTPSATADASRGIREFVVGTGGRSLNPFGKVRANSQVRNADTFGVLKLTLHPNAYDWKFMPVEGKSFTDSGSTQCN